VKEKGFTLIEILIAVLILGIVLSTVYASYTGTFRIIRETETDAELYGMARTVLERMTRDLEAVAPWTQQVPSQQTPQKALTFLAKPYSLGDRGFTRLTFRSSAHLAFGEREVPAGIAVIEYGVEEGTDKEGYALWRSDSLRRDPGKEEAPTGGFLLCDRIETLTYHFYDANGKDIETWDSNGDDAAQKRRAPVMVEIHLGLVNEKDRERPYLFTTRVRLPLNQVAGQ
jgi:general secretion pathway protein J